PSSCRPRSCSPRPSCSRSPSCSPRPSSPRRRPRRRPSCRWSSSRTRCSRSRSRPTRPETFAKPTSKYLLARFSPLVPLVQVLSGRSAPDGYTNATPDRRNFLVVAGHSEGVKGPVTARARSRGDDVDLARRCVLGDQAAHRELFQRERRRVHVILFRVLGSNADMDDLLQEVFIEVFRSIPGFRGEAALGTWL